MKPLEGIRILSVCQYGAGPFGMLHLADLGAEIIKIEDRNSKGDISRSVIPYAEDGDSLFFQAFNRNKKSITLNLKSAKGREIFRQLVEKSDGVFNNLRGDVPEKLGLTYEQLKSVNPRIVTCSLSGFGTSGSMKAEPAYDYLLQAMVGHMSLTGSPGGIPEKYGLSMIDFSTGIMAALGMMVGLFQSKIRGVGCDVDVSLFDTSASMLNYLAIWNLNRGYVPKRTAWSAHPSLVPSQLFPSSDGHLVVMCNKEKFFPILCDILGAPELATDERFCSFSARLENRELLIPELVDRFQRKPTDYWLAALSGKVPAAPVNTVEEALRHPLMAERNMVVEANHPRLGPLRMMGTPMKISGYTPSYDPAPPLGDQNAEIYGGLLGLSPAQIQSLEAENVL